MTLTCDALAPLYTRRLLGLLTETELDDVERHLETCPTCPEVEADLKAALDEALVESAAPPDQGWDALEKALDAGPPAAAARPELQAKVSVACSFCRAQLPSGAGVYCAACLAPHHQVCFEEHGRCCLPGCQETRFVAPTGVQPRQRRAGLWPLVFALGAGVGAAAWSATQSPPPVATTGSVVVTPAPVAVSDGPTYEGRTAEEWTQLLADRSGSFRQEAIAALVALEAEPVLRGLLQDEDPEVVRSAVNGLFELDPKALVPPGVHLAAFVSDDPDSKGRALERLLRDESSEATDVLADLLGREACEPGKRTEAIAQALVARDPQHERQAALLARLADHAGTPREVRKRLVVYAKLALGAGAPDAQAGLARVLASDPLAELRFDALRALAQTLERGDLTPHLLAALDDADITLRLTALAALQPDPSLVPHLVALLDDADPRARAQAGAHLATLGLEAERAIPALLRIFDSAQPNAPSEVVRVAARALARYGEATSPARATILEALTRLRWEDQALGDALHATRPPVPLLLQLLGHAEAHVRGQGARLLGLAAARLGDATPQVIEALVRLVMDDEYARHQAMPSLRRLAGHGLIDAQADLLQLRPWLPLEGVADDLAATLALAAADQPESAGLVVELISEASPELTWACVDRLWMHSQLIRAQREALLARLDPQFPVVGPWTAAACLLAQLEDLGEHREAVALHLQDCLGQDDLLNADYVSPLARRQAMHMLRGLGALGEGEPLLAFAKRNTAGTLLTAEAVRTLLRLPRLPEGAGGWAASVLREHLLEQGGNFTTNTLSLALELLARSGHPSAQSWLERCAEGASELRGRLRPGLQLTARALLDDADRAAPPERFAVPGLDSTLRDQQLAWIRIRLGDLRGLEWVQRRQAQLESDVRVHYPTRLLDAWRGDPSPLRAWLRELAQSDPDPRMRRRCAAAAARLE